MGLQLIKNGATLEQALQIAASKTKLFNRQFVVLEAGKYYTVWDALTITKNDSDLIVKDSICHIEDSSFTSYDCITCDRPICKWQIYKLHDGPR